jgi:hypothetical protein
MPNGSRKDSIRNMSILVSCSISLYYHFVFCGKIFKKQEGESCLNSK